MRSVQVIVELLAPTILSSVSPPFAILGHSTGALCAFELARELRRLGGEQPVHLFVAGRRAPQLAMDRTELDGLSVPRLADLMRRMGGTPEEILENDDLLGALQPTLAADFAVNEQYVYYSEPPLEVPITVFVATHDEGASPIR